MVVLTILILVVVLWRSGGSGDALSWLGLAGDTPSNHRVGFVTSVEGASLISGDDSSADAIAGGIVFPVLGEEAGGYLVLDVCNREGWLDADDVEPGHVPIDRSGFADSVFVVDAGHGYPDYGAIGPVHQLAETEVNLDVSALLVALLQQTTALDWESGRITAGSDYPAAGAVVMTRSPEGPNGGDYQLGLTFRAAVGNAVEATALVSIHHNSGSNTDLPHPGSEAYVSAFNPESARLGGLIVEELRRGLAHFEADWSGAEGSGVIARVGSDGDDYYTVIAQSEGPAVIVEGAYLSNPSEESLAMTTAFRQAYADGVYRALVRFITTDDDPIPAPEPQTFDPGGPSRTMDSCVVPPAGS